VQILSRSYKIVVIIVIIIYKTNLSCFEIRRIPECPSHCSEILKQYKVSVT
jgi:hypothetical protein